MTDRRGTPGGGFRRHVHTRDAGSAVPRGGHSGADYGYRRQRQRYLHSPAQARLISRITASRAARRRRALLAVSGAMSALVLLVSGSTWALTGYINDHIKRVNAGTGNAGVSGPLNILVAGVDPRTGLTHHQEVMLHVGNDVSSNSDTMMLMHVSANRTRVTVVSIPRDSWVNIPGHGMNKINAAYGFGGPQLMVQTAEQATGLTINDYVEVNLLGFVKVINALGGVNICLPQPLDDPYSGLRLSAGRHHLDGITALAYARDRHSFVSSDLARIQDQQRLLSSALTEAIGSGLLANPIRLSRFLSAAISSLTVNQGLNVPALANQMRGISSQDVTFTTVPLSSTDYQARGGELAVLWDNQAAGQLFHDLATDQGIARPATPPRKPAQAPGTHGGSGRPGGSPSAGPASSPSTGTGSAGHGSGSSPSGPGSAAGNSAARSACR
ncbi:MAG TPA: LCP family protein [Streptosporangiaceae bacterium]|nr:LCP family protein [Streptosporangiaceae bacterium]